MASWTGQSCARLWQSACSLPPWFPKRRLPVPAHAALGLCVSLLVPRATEAESPAQGSPGFPWRAVRGRALRGGGATSSRSPLPAASVVCPQGYAGWPLSVPRGMLGGLWPSPAARWPPGSQGPGTRGLKGSAAAADLGLLEGHASGRGARGLGGAVAPLGSRGSLTPPAGRSGGAQCKGPGPSLEWGLCGRVPFSFTLRWLCLGRRSIPQSPISS